MFPHVPFSVKIYILCIFRYTLLLYPNGLFNGKITVVERGWMHIALVYLGNGTVFYLNGIEVHHDEIPSSFTHEFGPGQLEIGRKYLGECVWHQSMVWPNPFCSWNNKVCSSCREGQGLSGHNTGWAVHVQLCIDPKWHNHHHELGQLKQSHRNRSSQLSTVVPKSVSFHILYCVFAVTWIICLTTYCFVGFSWVWVGTTQAQMHHTWHFQLDPSSDTVKNLSLRFISHINCIHFIIWDPSRAIAYNLIYCVFPVTWINLWQIMLVYVGGSAAFQTHTDNAQTDRHT